MQNIIKAIKALSDETRLRILNVLMERECCVCEVMQALDISQTRASRNLGILEDAGFLKSRREGTWILYSVDCESGNSYIVSLADMVKEFTTKNPVFDRDRERLKSAVRTGLGCVDTETVMSKKA
jgi:ArsR family transcriptional regulator